MSYARAIKRRTREAALRLTGSLGHGSHPLVNAIRGRRAAYRTDLAERMRLVVSRIYEAGCSPVLDGQICVDFGCGFLMSDAVVMRLLGAERSYAVDFNPIVGWAGLRRLLSGIDIEALAAAAPASVDVQGVRSRASELGSAARAADLGSALKERGIEYLAPFDATAEPFPEPVHLIYSASTLEHVPIEAASSVLAALSEALTDGGAMIHAINLQDHRDMRMDPFGFLRDGDGYDSSKDFDARGNRLRPSDWRTLFEAQPDLRYNEVRVDRPSELPDFPVVPELAQRSPDDVFATVLTVLATRPGGRAGESR